MMVPVIATGEVHEAAGLTLLSRVCVGGGVVQEDPDVLMLLLSEKVCV